MTFVSALIFLALLGGLLWLIFNVQDLISQGSSNQLSQIAKMSRHAKRHNTVLRYFNGIPFVVTNQQRGLVYMLAGKNVSRAELIQALGDGARDKVLKVEDEEQLVAPSPTKLTALFTPKANRSAERSVSMTANPPLKTVPAKPKAAPKQKPAAVAKNSPTKATPPKSPYANQPWLKK